MIRLADKSRQEHEATQRLEKLQGIQIDSEKRNYDSLYHAILASSLPEEEKRPERMAHEGFEVLLAGSDTTARTMGIAVFHVLANKDIQVRLRKELETVMPDPQSVIELRTLQGLPWLVSEEQYCGHRGCTSDSNVHCSLRTPLSKKRSVLERSPTIGSVSSPQKSPFSSRTGLFLRVYVSASMFFLASISRS